MIMPLCRQIFIDGFLVVTSSSVSVTELSIDGSAVVCPSVEDVSVDGKSVEPSVELASFELEAVVSVAGASVETASVIGASVGAFVADSVIEASVDPARLLRNMRGAGAVTTLS